MLNALVLLPRVLHILALDQNLKLGLDGGLECRSRRVASRAAILALASHPPVLADAPAPALLALASHPPVLADARAPALLALVSNPPVLADARAPALLAAVSLPPVLADARAPALLAPASLPPVLADSFPRALLAEIPSLLPAVHARPIAPRPRGRARTLSEGRCHGGTRGGCDARLRRRARGTQSRPGRSTPSVNNASSRARLTTPPDSTAARRPLTRFTRSAAPSACRCIPREL